MAYFHLKAALTLLATEDGGKKGPVFEGYRPDWVFDGFDLGYCHGQLLKIESKTFHPGDTQLVEIIVVRRDRPEVLKQFIATGQEFSAMEGPRQVARGRIVEVIESDLD